MKLVAVFLAALVAGPAAAQTTWFVDASATPPGSGTALDPYASIQYALAASSTVDGDTVQVGPGVYLELVDFLGKNVVLTSSGGPDVTTIDGSAVPTLDQTTVKIWNGEGVGCELVGFTIRGGLGTELTDPVLGPYQYAGGGILLVGSAPTIRDCRIVYNYAPLGCGVYGSGAQPTFEDCVVSNNVATKWGGGFHFTLSDVHLERVEIDDNLSSNQDGGGISLFGGRLVAIDCELDGNESRMGGNGASIAADFGAEVELTSVIVRNGFVLDGLAGGVWASGCTLDIQGCSFLGNVAGDSSSNQKGGALYVVNGTVTIVDSVFGQNQSGRGGAVYLETSTARILRTDFVSNSCVSGLNFGYTDGGALTSVGSTVKIRECSFLGNLAENRGPFIHLTTARGGALWCDTSTVRICDSLFEENHAYYNGPVDPYFTKKDAGAQGGAIFGPAVVLNSIIRGNQATSRSDVSIARAEGGGVYGAELRNCFLVDNEVMGTGPIPDSGPAAEACTVTCVKLEGNLPTLLPPLGPGCVHVEANCTLVPSCQPQPVRKL